MIPENKRIKNIRLVKLITGEVIISYITPEDELKLYLTSDNSKNLYMFCYPKKIDIDMIKGEQFATLSEWMPCSSNNISLVNKDKVITIMFPNSHILDIYINNYIEINNFLNDDTHKTVFLRQYWPDSVDEII